MAGQDKCKSSSVSKSLDILGNEDCFVYSVRLPQTVNEAWVHQTHVSSVIKHGLTTEQEDNIMLNKVVVFVIFGPKCTFCLYFLSGQGQYTIHTFPMEGQKLSD